MPCTARDSLTRQLTAAIDELLFLLDEARTAVVQEDFGMADTAWNEFRRVYPNKELVFERLQLHVAEHGCALLH
jgi:hypothetical protein